MVHCFLWRDDLLKQHLAVCDAPLFSNLVVVWHVCDETEEHLYI